MSPLPLRKHVFLRIVSLVWLSARAAPMCFPSAIPEENRKSLQGPDGPYPIGVWVCDWPAAYVTSAVVHILLEEILGFNVIQTGPGPSTVDGFYALTGCADPTNIQERGCSSEPVVTKNHINVEGWTEAYTTTWAQIQNDYPQNAPRNLGNMGYFGKTSMYLPTSIKHAAYDTEGLILEFYRGFNVSWTQAEKYFDPPSSIPKERLKPCNETRLMVTKAMEEYAHFTGDWAGVEVGSDENGKRVVTGKCWSNYFWYPPACRDDPSKCIIFFTGGSGWNLEETMQKASAWNMPLAPAVAVNWGNYTKLPREIDSAFYWWVPDPTFLMLNPVEITFPPFDRFAHTRGDKRTAPEALSVDKYVSQDLQARAPEAEQLIRSLIIDLEVVNNMLRDQLNTGAANWEVACRWLQGNEDLWQSWLPDPTKCVAGFGLYNKNADQFVMDREDPSNLICNPCPSGRFSSKLVDSKGFTYVCEPCAAGTVQPSGASLECVPCKAGEYQDVNGSISCKRCGIDEYQDQTGAVGCIACPAGTGTAGLGSVFLADCGCREGSMNMANTSGEVAPQCITCSEGLHCPLGSTLESLTSGKAALGELYTPKIKQGYFSTEENPTEVFKCEALEICPGGTSGTCAGGRTGVPCSGCPSSESWNGDECVQCAGGLGVVPVVAVCVFLLSLTFAYYLLPAKVKSKADPRQAIGMGLGVVASLVQCMAIIGLTSVKWPTSFQAVSVGSGVILLDLDSFSISCMLSGPESWRYILSILVFPFGILWLLLCFVSSSYICRCRCGQGGQWSRVRAMNTAGHFLQVGFSTMSALALQPLMCYEHPNGQQSLLKYSGVFCGSGEQTMMMLFGLLLLGSLTVSFFGICAWAAWRIPKWSINAPRKAEAFSFLISRFKMDRWWYGVPFLLRGPLLSLCPVLATDFPPAQAALLSMVLTASVLMHMLFLPWKVPLVNLVDGWVQSMLLLLVAITPSMNSGSQSDTEDFYEYVAVITLVCVALALAFLALSVIFAQLYVMTRGTSRGVGNQDLAILNLGTRQSGALVTQMTKEVAQALLELEDEQVQGGFDRLHCGDLSRIVAAIELIGDEVAPTGKLELQRSRVTSKRGSIANLDLVGTYKTFDLTIAKDPDALPPGEDADNQKDSDAPPPNGEDGDDKASLTFHTFASAQDSDATPAADVGDDLKAGNAQPNSELHSTETESTLSGDPPVGGQVVSAEL